MRIDYKTLEDAYKFLSSHWAGVRPSMGMILGSGWSAVVKAFEEVDSVPFSKIPGLGDAGVQGHAGLVSLVKTEGEHIIVFQGRRHFYEGVGWTPIALPIYLFKRFGCKSVLLSNACGGIASHLKPGDIVVVRDHITNMIDNPLIGPHNPIWGERFPDMTYVYTPELRAKVIEVGKKLDEEISEGIYFMSPGPAYETPAQVKLARTLGADIIGMSTVPEATLTRAAGMNCVCVVCITNLAAGISKTELSHKEVIEVSALATSRLQALLVEFTRSFFKSQPEA